MKTINENGRSMVEMLGVLAIIGVLSVGGIAGYSKAMNKYKLNKMFDQMSMIVANTRTMYATQTNYDGLGNKNAKQFGLVPSEMYASVTDSKLSNAYSGQVTIKTLTYRGTAQGAFVISHANIPSEACVSLLSSDWGSDTSSGLIGLGVVAADGSLPETASDTPSATYGTPTGDNSANKAGIPFSLTLASAACGSNTTKTVYWIYY